MTTRVVRSKAARGADAPEPERELESRLGYRFRNRDLLRLALTHRSWRHAQPAAEPAGAAGGDNERFEFLGDAVMGLRVSERLLSAYPASPEGELSRMRSWIVSARHLGAVAQALELGQYLRLSRSEEAIGGRTKPRLLANAVEAVIAAVHLDGGYAAACRLVDRHVLGTSLDQAAPGQWHEFAYKSALQEWAHAAGRAVPTYRVVRAHGPEHEKVFTVEVSLPGVFTGTASAPSKKEAEQRAAAAALAHLGLVPHS